jgi:hypothetical protein
MDAYMGLVLADTGFICQSVAKSVAHHRQAGMSAH